MNQEVEIEFKNSVTKKEFNELRSHFSIEESDFTVQRNHYFDTENFALRSHQAALRIREKKNQATLTLKQPHHVGLLESHQTLTPEMVTTSINGKGIPKGEIADHIFQTYDLNRNQFQYLGTLTTKRAEIAYRGGILFFDHSLYLDTEDYEIEYEGNEENEAKKTFVQLLSTYSIPIRESENKIVRFFTRKGKNSSL